MTTEANDFKAAIYVSGVPQKDLEGSIVVGDTVAQMIQAKLNIPTFVSVENPTFSWLNATDSDGDDLTYEIQLSQNGQWEHSSTFIEANIPEDSDGVTSHRITHTLSPDIIYNWRVRAWDGYEHSDWSEPLAVIYAVNTNVISDVSARVTVPKISNLNSTINIYRGVSARLRIPTVKNIQASIKVDNPYKNLKATVFVKGRKDVFASINVTHPQAEEKVLGATVKIVEYRYTNMMARIFVNGKSFLKSKLIVIPYKDISAKIRIVTLLKARVTIPAKKDIGCTMLVEHCIKAKVTVRQGSNIGASIIVRTHSQEDCGALLSVIRGIKCKITVPPRVEMIARINIFRGLSASITIQQYRTMLATLNVVPGDQAIGASVNVLVTEQSIKASLNIRKGQDIKSRISIRGEEIGARVLVDIPPTLLHSRLVVEIPPEQKLGGLIEIYPYRGLTGRISIFCRNTRTISASINIFKGESNLLSTLNVQRTATDELSGKLYVDVSKQVIDGRLNIMLIEDSNINSTIDVSANTPSKVEPYGYVVPSGYPPLPSGWIDPSGNAIPGEDAQLVPEGMWQQEDEILFIWGVSDWGDKATKYGYIVAWNDDPNYIVSDSDQYAPDNHIKKVWEDGGDMWFHIRPKNSFGWLGEQSDYNVKINTLPTPPQDLKIVEQNENLEWVEIPGGVTNDLRPYFSFKKSTDADQLDTLQYKIQVLYSNGTNFEFFPIVDQGTGGTVVRKFDLPTDIGTGTHQWRVVAHDGKQFGEWSEWAPFVTIATQENVQAKITLVRPWLTNFIARANIIQHRSLGAAIHVATNRDFSATIDVVAGALTAYIEVLPLHRLDASLHVTQKAIENIGASIYIVGDEWLTTCIINNQFEDNDNSTSVSGGGVASVETKYMHNPSGYYASDFAFKDGHYVESLIFGEDMDANPDPYNPDVKHPLYPNNPGFCISFYAKGGATLRLNDQNPWGHDVAYFCGVKGHDFELSFREDVYQLPNTRSGESYVTFKYMDSKIVFYSGQVATPTAYKLYNLNVGKGKIELYINSYKVGEANISGQIIADKPLIIGGLGDGEVVSYPLTGGGLYSNSIEPGYIDSFRISNRRLDEFEIKSMYLGNQQLCGGEILAWSYNVGAMLNVYHLADIPAKMVVTLGDQRVAGNINVIKYKPQVSTIQSCINVDVRDQLLGANIRIIRPGTSTLKASLTNVSSLQSVKASINVKTVGQIYPTGYILPEGYPPLHQDWKDSEGHAQPGDDAILIRDGVWQEESSVLFIWEIPEWMEEESEYSYLVAWNQTPDYEVTVEDQYVANNYIDKTAFDSGSYYFHIRAINNAGGISEETTHYNVLYNHIPSEPVSPFKTNDEQFPTINTLTPTFTWGNATDVDQLDILSYGIQISDSYTFDNILRSVDNISSDGVSSVTSYKLENNIKLTEEGDYYWRVRAYDTKQYGQWSPGQLFIIKAQSTQIGASITIPVQSRVNIGAKIYVKQYTDMGASVAIYGDIAAYMMASINICRPFDSEIKSKIQIPKVNKLDASISILPKDDLAGSLRVVGCSKNKEIVCKINVCNKFDTEIKCRIRACKISSKGVQCKLFIVKTLDIKSHIRIFKEEHFGFIEEFSRNMTCRIQVIQKEKSSIDGRMLVVADRPGAVHITSNVCNAEWQEENNVWFEWSATNAQFNDIEGYYIRLDREANTQASDSFQRNNIFRFEKDLEDMSGAGVYYFHVAAKSDNGKFGPTSHYAIWYNHRVSSPTSPMLTNDKNCISAPILVSSKSDIVLEWGQSTDVDQLDIITYVIQIATQEDFGLDINETSSILYEQDSLNMYRHTIPTQTLSYGTYYWRVKAYDGHQYSLEWSPTGRFIINTPPSAPTELIAYT